MSTRSLQQVSHLAKPLELPKTFKYVQNHQIWVCSSSGRAPKSTCAPTSKAYILTSC